jgi:hypothetical protein
MTSPIEAIACVERGEAIRCTREEWPAIRAALQRAGGRWIDGGHEHRAIIAMNEIHRLDAELDHRLGGS